jgi:hypothetical protein
VWCKFKAGVAAPNRLPDMPVGQAVTPAQRDNRYPAIAANPAPVGRRGSTFMFSI